MKDLYTVDYEREKQIQQRHWDNIVIDNIKANCCPGFKKFFRDKRIDKKNIVDTKVQLLQLAKIWEEETEEGTLFKKQCTMSQKPAQLVMQAGVVDPPPPENGQQPLQQQPWQGTYQLPPPNPHQPSPFYGASAVPPPHCISTMPNKHRSKLVDDTLLQHT